MRGVNDDEAVAAAALVPRPAATSCGSSSRCRSTPSTAGTATTMVTADEILATLADARSRSTPVDADERGSAPAEAWRGRRRARPGRRHRLGDPAVLRRLRPGPADRRRPDRATACSPARSPTCGRRCARARTTTALGEMLKATLLAQARRARHRRPRLPAAEPPDVGHRRLTGRLRADQPWSAAAQPCSVLIGRTGRIGRPLGVRHGLPQEAPGRQEVGEVLAMGVARRPGLAPLRARAASGCSRPAPRSRAPGSPWPSRPVRWSRCSTSGA